MKPFVIHSNIIDHDYNSDDYWSSILLAQEPDPRDYMTYNDFEQAYLKWASISSNLSIIPPHPNQLHEIIPISKPIELFTTYAEKTTLVEIADVPRKVGLIIVDFWESDISVRDMLPPPPQIIELKYSFDFEQTYLDKAVLNRILAALDKIINSANLSKSSNGRIGKKIYPKIAGRSSHSNDAYTNYIGEIKCRNDVLRRTDLEPDQIITTHLNSNNIDEIDIQFSIPNYDISELDYNKLCKDQQYKNNMKKNVLRLCFHDINYPLYSWYYPTRKNEKTDKSNIIKELLKNTKENQKYSLEDLKDILTNDMYTDEFENMLNHVIETDSGKSISCIEILLNSLPDKAIESILNLFVLSSNRLVHAKVSMFIYNAFQSPTFKNIADDLLCKSSIKNLSLITYAMTFFSEIPVDLFPYRESLILLILDSFGNKYKELIDCFYRYYYIGIIKDIVTREAYRFTSIIKYIQKLRKDLTQQLIIQINSNPDFLKKDIISNISHRSKQISSFFLFLCIRLMNDDESSGVIQELLTKPQNNIVAQIKILSKSKFSHSRFASRRLISIMKSESWLHRVVNLLSNTLYDDLLNPDTTSQDYYEFLVEVTAFSIKKAIVEKSYSSINWIMNDARYQQILQNSINSRNDDDSITLHKLNLLKEILRGASKLGCIKSYETKSTHSSVSILVSPKDLYELLELLKQPPVTDSKFASDCDSLILSCIRYMIKSPQVFDIIKYDHYLHKSISNFCGMTKEKECKESWKTFYQIIKYHKGSIELLMKNNILNNYLDNLSISNGHIPTYYSLYYLNKAFSLPGVQLFKKSGSVKHKIDHNIKQLNIYFIRSHLFIKVHMMYKKLFEKKNGAAFAQLVKFYVILTRSQNLKKLFKEISKNEEFKEGIKRMVSISYMNEKKSNQKTKSM